MKRRYWCYAICQFIRNVLKCILNVCFFFKLIIDFMIKQLKEIQKSDILVNDGPCEDSFLQTFTTTTLF